MPDIYLWTGDASPSNVILRDPTKSGGPITIIAIGVPSGEALGYPTVVLVIVAQGAPSGEALGLPTVVLVSGGRARRREFMRRLREGVS